jgi:OHCU decarboxylase
METAQPDMDWLDALSDSAAETEFLKCCGSRTWARRMVENRPFTNIEELTAKATDTWWKLERNDWLEAFRSHPKIGERNAAAEVSAQARSWSGQEQSGVQNSAAQTLDELATLNHEYETRFGYIYIVCATGKSSEEMLSILKTRIGNDATTELPIAAAEQAKITELRLRKLIQ